MFEFLTSASYDRWFSTLSDTRAKAKILARLRLAMQGNFGDTESVGDGVSEMRIHYGPGYRLYYKRHGHVIYLLLLGGDKSTQKRDIKRALQMARNIGKETS